jgi:16S rRNA (guanine527-N7)-methyltransferase
VSSRRSSDALVLICERWDLPAGAKEQFERLVEVLVRDPRAPTAVATPGRAVDIHVADSLSALEIEGVRSAATLADIGSGAGFPGVVLAIAMAGTRVDLVESSQRKCEFLERLVTTLHLENTSVVCARAEEWAAGAGRERYALATARAVAPLPTLVEYAAPLLREGGLLVAWKGRRDPDEERRAAVSATTIGMRPVAAGKVEPFAASRSRHLHTYQKVAPTPPGYPRRPGMAKKRPLGGRPSKPSGVCEEDERDG